MATDTASARTSLVDQIRSRNFDPGIVGRLTAAAKKIRSTRRIEPGWLGYAFAVGPKIRAIAVHCDHCRGEFRTPESANIRQAKCPRCGEVISVPTNGEQVATATLMPKTENEAVDVDIPVLPPMIEPMPDSEADNISRDCFAGQDKEIIARGRLWHTLGQHDDRLPFACSIVGLPKPEYPAAKWDEQLHKLNRLFSTRVAGDGVGDWITLLFWLADFSGPAVDYHVESVWIPLKGQAIHDPVRLWSWVDLPRWERGELGDLAAGWHFLVLSSDIRDCTLEAIREIERMATTTAETANNRPDAVADRNLDTTIAQQRMEQNDLAALQRLLNVYANGVAEERMTQAMAILQDSSLFANDKLMKIDSKMRLPPTASAEQIGGMLGVSKQAVMKTAWWITNRKGERISEVGRRRAMRSDRAKQSNSRSTDEDRQQE